MRSGLINENRIKGVTTGYTRCITLLHNGLFAKHIFYEMTRTRLMNAKRISGRVRLFVETRRNEHLAQTTTFRMGSLHLPINPSKYTSIPYIRQISISTRLTTHFRNAVLKIADNQLSFAVIGMVMSFRKRVTASGSKVTRETSCTTERDISICLLTNN